MIVTSSENSALAPAGVDGDEGLMRELDAELDLYTKLGLLSGKAKGQTRFWELRMTFSPNRFIRKGPSVNSTCINRDSIRNFRKMQILVDDNPLQDPHVLSMKNMFDGSRRGERAMLKACRHVLEQQKFLTLLKQYPPNSVGNPFTFKYKGLSYTHRWVRHIYFLGMLNRHLSKSVKGEPVVMDIGSSYGIFSDLVKRQYPESHHVLVDFPEQLLLARYYLKTLAPQARVAGVGELAEQGDITRQFINKFDFVLLPTTWYDRLSAGSVDLITNFSSLGEMTRTWFDYYIQAPVFKSAGYFFTANPVEDSIDLFGTDICILDYPIWNPAQRMYFSISPVFFSSYEYPTRKYLFFYKKRQFVTYFEYIGKIKP